MKKIVLGLVIAAAVLGGALPGPAAGIGQVDLGLSVSDGRLSAFYLAVGSHYRVAPRVVVDFRTRYRLLDEELPVVFFLAARARVNPQVVIDLRLGKRSWLDVAIHIGLSPEIFFVPLGIERIGPPYGNAYGYYRKYGLAGDWRKVSLADREVIDLVNLRFMSEYHGMSPHEIISLRGRHGSFVRIHEEISRRRSPAPQNTPGRGAKEAARAPKGVGKKK